ncbi:MAG: Cof-type HAD-IIB family hydrolase [Christensenellales bacterium]
MKYKAIFSDFDGTLYRSDYTISSANKDAIRRFIDEGGHFVLATGRLFQSILPKAKELGLKGELICYQGAGVYDIESRQLKYSNFFDRELALRVADFLDRRKYLVGMAYVDDECCVEYKNPYTDTFASICQIPYNVTGKSLHDFMTSSSLPIKLIALIEPDRAQPLIEEAKAEFGDKVVMCRSNPVIVEFLPVGINKGNAVKEVCKMHGWSLDEVIAIGDSENDISMIETAGLGIATANAFEITKSKADFVSVSNDDDAIAQIIYRFCLEKQDR